MGEPIWILWVAGLAAVVGGPLLFKHREQAAYVIRQSNPFFDSSKDSTGEGGMLFLPAIMAPPLGLLVLFYSVDRTFGWGIT